MGSVRGVSETGISVVWGPSPKSVPRSAAVSVWARTQVQSRSRKQSRGVRISREGFVYGVLMYVMLLFWDLLSYH